MVWNGAAFTQSSGDKRCLNRTTSFWSNKKFVIEQQIFDQFSIPSSASKFVNKNCLVFEVSNHAPNLQTICLKFSLDLLGQLSDSIGQFVPFPVRSKSKPQLEG